jgi:predicted O-methyltransferase YrrM
LLIEKILHNQFASLPLLSRLPLGDRIIRLLSLFDHYKASRELYGKPCYPATFPVRLIIDRLRWGPLGRYISLSRRIPGWTRDAEAVALAHLSQSLPHSAVILEIGCFLGCSTVLLAGARKLRGSGKVHCVDPFDASGDAFSVPIYRVISNSLRTSLRQCFEDNIRRAGLSELVEIHQSRACELAATWTEPLDLLFLDGDHSYLEVRSTYESWFPFLKLGGIIAVHNSASGSYHEDHDGSMRLVSEKIHSPQYDEVRCIGTTTFARKVIDHEI